MLSVAALCQPAGSQPLPALLAGLGARLELQPGVGHGWGKACWSSVEKGGQESEEMMKTLFAGCADPSFQPWLGKGGAGNAARRGA